MWWMCDLEMWEIITYHEIHILYELCRNFHLWSHEIRSMCERMWSKWYRHSDSALHIAPMKILWKRKTIRVKSWLRDNWIVPTIVGENLNFTQTQTPLDANQLNGNILPDQWTSTGKRFRDALLECPREPGTQWIPLQIKTAIAHTNL